MKDLERRVDECVLEMYMNAAWGQVLVKWFPEAKTGDEDPLEVCVFHDAIERYVKHWVHCNVEKN